MSDRKSKAVELFEQKYNCTQAILLAYSDLFNVERDTALKLASGFGGGIAATGGVCGVISGAVMVLGLKYGFTDSTDTNKKIEERETIRNFIKEFKTNHKGIECRQLLVEDEGVVHKMHSGKCRALVEEACDLLEKYI